MRIAKVNPNNPFGSGPIRQWYHVDCFFGLKKTKNSKQINSNHDVKGWDLLDDDDKSDIIKKIGSDFKVSGSSPSRKPQTDSNKGHTKDNLFSEFQRIVDKVANESSYNSKSQILQKYLRDVSL